MLSTICPLGFGLKFLHTLLACDFSLGDPPLPIQSAQLMIFDLGDDIIYEMTIDSIEPAFIDIKETMDLLNIKIDRLEERVVEHEHRFNQINKKLKAIDTIFHKAVRK